MGLMSGTSADGVTAALMRFSGRSVCVLRHKTTPYSPRLKARVLGAADMTACELSRLNMELGESFARAALKLLPKPRLIGSHGQTVWHGPEQNPPNTLQLAEPCVIAERTGADVVADFRPRDMAAGGQGAPLMPAFDEFLFSSGPLRAVQNIGGIANVSIVGKGKLWSAFDTGPGNGLMDLAVRLATGGRQYMDKDGRLTAHGKPDRRKIDALLRHPYFRRKPPKSLDKSFFGETFLRRHFGPLRRGRLPDILASLCMLTARSISDSYRRFTPWGLKIEEVIVSGGGALNPLLMKHLARELAPVAVARSEKYGIPAMAKEAACFAWLACRARRGRTNNCPKATGSRGRRILGKIILGDGRRK